jgi:CheY-like chemotaxis protein
MPRVPGEPNVSVVKLLVVDDSPSMRAIIRSAVHDLGCEIRDCDNGLDAVEQFRAWLPDWVVMDLRIPGIDGLTSTRRIRAEFPGARIVVVSIQHGRELHEAAEAAGARWFLHKSQLSDLPIILSSDEQRKE